MATQEASRPLDALATRVAAAAGGLSEDQRTALLLREREGATYREIASACAIEAGDVPDLLVAARLAVRGAVRHALAPPKPTAYCDDARRLLTLRQDGEHLSADEVRWVRAHVDHCDGCRQARRAFREATLACRAWDGAPLVLAPASVEAAPEPAAAGPAARTAVRRPAPRRRHGVGVMTAGAVAVTVVVVGTAAFTNDEPARTPASERTAAPQPARTPPAASTPRPRRASTGTPAAAPKPDVIPGDGDRFCIEGDPGCR